MNKTQPPYFETPAVLGVLSPYGEVIVAGQVPTVRFAEGGEPQMRIFQSASENVAAQSIYITGEEYILALQKACGEVLSRLRANRQTAMELKGGA